MEGGWLPSENFTFDKTLLRHTLGLPPRTTTQGPNSDFAHNSEQNKARKRETLKRIRTLEQKESDSNSNPNPDQDSRFSSPIKRHQYTSKIERRRKTTHPDLKKEALPYQEGLPLQEKDVQELQQPDREIFMAMPGETRVLDSDTLDKVNLVDYNSSDFDEFLSDTEAPPDPMEVTNYGPPNKPLGVSVTIHLDEETSEQRKIRNQRRKIWRRASTLRH